MDRLKKIVLCITAIVVTSIGGLFVRLFTSNKLEYRAPYRYVKLSHSPNSLNCSREEIRNDLNKLFNAKTYKYKEKDLGGEYGRTNPIMRVVIIDNDIDIHTYAFYLAHELVHLTHFTTSERYCNLVAFKTLYNTEKYRDVAIEYAIEDRDGGIPKERSCWEYIVDYLILD